MCQNDGLWLYPGPASRWLQTTAAIIVVCQHWHAPCKLLILYSGESYQ